MDIISELCTQQYMSAYKLHSGSAASQNLNPSLGLYNQNSCEDTKMVQETRNKWTKKGRHGLPFTGNLAWLPDSFIVAC